MYCKERTGHKSLGFLDGLIKTLISFGGEGLKDLDCRFHSLESRRWRAFTVPKWHLLQDLGLPWEPFFSLVSCDGLYPLRTIKLDAILFMGRPCESFPNLILADLTPHQGLYRQFLHSLSWWSSPAKGKEVFFHSVPKSPVYRQGLWKIAVLLWFCPSGWTYLDLSLSDTSLRGSHGLSARRARRTSRAGPKGRRLEVGAKRAP